MGEINHQYVSYQSMLEQANFEYQNLVKELEMLQTAESPAEAKEITREMLQNITDKLNNSETHKDEDKDEILNKFKSNLDYMMILEK